jgi:subtilisin family serine protease
MRRLSLVLAVIATLLIFTPVKADGGFVDDDYVLVEDSNARYGYRFVEKKEVIRLQECFPLPEIYTQQEERYYHYLPLVFKASEIIPVPTRPTPTPTPRPTLNDEHIELQYGPQMMGVEEVPSVYTRSYTQVARIAFLDSGWSPIEDQPTNDITGWNYFTGNADTTDDDTHGYHVQSISAAPHNETGIAGICPHCEGVHLKVCEGGRCSLRAIILAIDWCTENDVDVMSMSFGGYGDPQSEAWSMVENALKRARENGVLPVAAAGNHHVDMLIYPAGFDSVVSVGGIDEDLDLAYFSNYGEKLDFVAPSFGVYAYTSPAETWYKSGTSMATPHVSAAAGIIKSLYPGFSPDEVYDALKDSACDLGEPGKDNTFGWGVPTIHRVVYPEMGCNHYKGK